MFDTCNRPGGHSPCPHRMKSRHQLVNGRKMIDPHPLVQRWKGVSDQEAWAQRCNASLDCPACGPPPWPADRFQMLRDVMELAGD